jgi:hypothetical protein
MKIIEKDYVYDELIYNLYDDGTAVFVGTKIEGSITIPETISKGNDNYTVTSIDCDWSALIFSENIIRIRIPKSVISIHHIEDFCSENLNCIEVQHGNTKFTTIDGVLFDKEITKLIMYPAGKPDEHYSIPNSVTYIEWGAFKGCTSLNSISIPDSVREVGDRAFKGCTSLNSIIIPNSVTNIGRSAFRCCTSLNSINIPNSVTNIGDWAFYGCTNLNSIIIPDSVTDIVAEAFRGCTSLNSIIIPNSVTNIGRSAFFDCSDCA